MKKLILIILIIFSGLSLIGQTYETQGLAIGDPDVAGSGVIVIDSLVRTGSVLVFYGLEGTELLTFDSTGISDRIDLKFDQVNFELTKLEFTAGYAYLKDSEDNIVTLKDNAADITELDDISVDLIDIIQFDSITNSGGLVKNWEGAVQRYPDISGSVSTPAYWELLGSTVKAIPLGSEMYVGGAIPLADAEEFMMVYYLHDTTVITGARVTLSVQGDYTADAYNGIALYSNSTSGIVLIDSTLNGAGDIWKAAAGATIDSTFAAGPHTLAPGLYTVSVLYNQSEEVTAPVVVGRSTLVSNYARYAFTNDRKLTGRVATRAAPADIVHSSITGYSYCVQVVLY